MFETECIPNKTGLTKNDDHSDHLVKEISHWRKEKEKRQCEKFSKMSYWQKVSSCSAL